MQISASVCLLFDMQIWPICLLFDMQPCLLFDRQTFSPAPELAAPGFTVFAPSVGCGRAVMQGQPGEGVIGCDAHTAAMAVYESCLLGFEDRGRQLVRTDPESVELAGWRLQVAVFFASMRQVLQHQEIEKPTRVNAERSPCIAGEQFLPQHNEAGRVLCIARHRRSLRASMRSTARSSAKARCVASALRPAAAPLFALKVSRPLLRPSHRRARATSSELASEDRTRHAGL